jgi:cyclophilin family peptidyl-prolyl cis-trans isomerase
MFALLSVAIGIPMEGRLPYGNPFAGPCLAGELNLSISGVPGLYCAPHCNERFASGCNPAKPADSVAMAECIIGVNSTQNNYCALICNTDAKEDQCDTKGGAACHHVSGVQGVCTYTAANVTAGTAAAIVGRFNSVAAPAPAPESFVLTLATDVDGLGDVSVNITRAWAPIGVDRLWALVHDKFFDGAAFFRVVGGFIVQFGIAGTPAENTKWDVAIKDDPVVKSNLRHTLTYATAGPDTRTTQLFFNYKDNTELDAQGFAPIGIAVVGTEYLDRLHDPTPGDSNGVNQTAYEEGGDAWIREHYPEINFIKSTSVVTY